MADELTIAASLAFSKSGLSVSARLDADTLNVTGTEFIHNVASIGFAAAEALALGDVSPTGLGWMYVKNLDATNYVLLRNGAAGADVVKLKAGEVALFRWPADAVPYALANTAAVRIEYLLIED